jgi:hypothetical protein
MGEPMSMPLPTTRQRFGSLPKFEQVGDNTLMMRGCMPAELRMRAAMLFGLTCVMRLRNSGDSTNVTRLPALFARRPS